MTQKIDRLLWLAAALFIALAVALALSRCASSNDDVRPGASAEEDSMIRAKCQMKADEGILIPGLPQHWMKQCMESNGYLERAQ